jgi:hypothetical protein
MRNDAERRCRKVKSKKHLLCSIPFIFEKLAVYEIILENTVEPGRPQTTIRPIHIACWIPKAINTNSENVILTAFPLQQRLYELASMIRYTHIACFVISYFMLGGGLCNYLRWAPENVATPPERIVLFNDAVSC